MSPRLQSGGLNICLYIMCLFRPKRAIYSANGEAGKPPRKPGVKPACIDVNDDVALDRSTVRVQHKAGTRDNTDQALSVNSPPAPLAGRWEVASYDCEFEFESSVKQGDSRNRKQVQSDDWPGWRGAEPQKSQSRSFTTPATLKRVVSGLETLVETNSGCSVH